MAQNPVATPANTLRHLRLASTPRSTQPQVRFYDVVSGDGTRLQAWTNDLDGSLAKAGAPTVLLCNGLGTPPWAWPSLIDPASPVRVISWYHRGVGGSERPADLSRSGIDAFVEDALAVMDDAGLDRAPVMGWSMGVNTAFELATLHPERVAGLFAVAGVPGGTFSSMLAPMFVPRPLRAVVTVNAVRLMKALGKPLTALTRHLLPPSPLLGQLVSHTGFMLPTPDVELTDRTIRELLTTPVEWYMHLALATSKHVRVSLSAIDVPTVFLAGRWDLLASSHDMRTAAERMSDASYVELPATHFVAMEKPAEVHELLLEWLGRVG